MSNTSNQDFLLRAENLTKHYQSADVFLDKVLGKTGLIKAVDDVNFEVYEGETLGIVGESGCGKTTLGRTLIRLLEPTAGNVYYKDQNLMDLSSKEMRGYRKDLQYIFQNPFASLNPRLTVGDIIGEPLDIHGLASGEDRQNRIYELLEIVGLKPSQANRYPHEFSGGQRQRIGIARALAVDPDLIICDEPVSALDVSVQAQILNLLEKLQTQFGLSYIFIAHDLSVVEHISDRIGVMYLGEIVEMGTTEEIFSEPYHPYTEALLSAIPEPDPLWNGDRIILEGSVPSPLSPPTGCKFHTRCPRVIPPEAYNMSQGTWRSLVALKTQLKEESTSTDDLVRKSQSSESDAEIKDVPSAIREKYSLPLDGLRDSDAEEVLTKALLEIEAGDVATANDILSSEFQTPCEVDDPKLISREGAHPIACHLFDQRSGSQFVSIDDGNTSEDRTGTAADD